jgi:hypothetical protein
MKFRKNLTTLKEIMKFNCNLKPTVISLFTLAFLQVQNPAIALVNPEKLADYSINSGWKTAQNLSKKQPIQIVQLPNCTKYVAPQEDTEICLPGKETENNNNILMTTNTRTQTVYMFSRKDLPSETLVLSSEDIRQVLQVTLRATLAAEGKVVKSTNMVIEGYPGIELLIQHSDGTQGQYQGYVVRRRLYLLGARATDELTTEAANFFDSFRVYPTRIVNSN